MGGERRYSIVEVLFGSWSGSKQLIIIIQSLSGDLAQMNNITAFHCQNLKLG